MSHNSRHIISATGAQGTGVLALTVLAEGSRVRISIIGEIYHGWTSEDFRWQMDNARKNGAKDIVVYLNTVGGDVFAANEIVNIISEFIKETGGTVTGKGGAIVASAGTFIAVHCQKFTMAKNGSFMIHKPHGRASGSADEFESYVKLLRNLESQYADAYALKTGKSKEDIEALYAKSDYWLTAAQAKEQGFIDAIDGEEEITAETRAMFAAVGRPVPTSPVATAPKISNNFNPNTMTVEELLRLQATAMGLPLSATQEQIMAEIQKLRNASTAYANIVEANKNRERESRQVEIDNVVGAAVKDMRIHADASDFWKSRLVAASTPEAYNAAVAELKALTPAKSLAEGQHNGGRQVGATTEVPADRANWSFDEWNQKDPQGLIALSKSDESAYLALYNAKYKGNRTSL